MHLVNFIAALLSRPTIYFFHFLFTGLCRKLCCWPFSNYKTSDHRHSILSFMLYLFSPRWNSRDCLHMLDRQHCLIRFNAFINAFRGQGGALVHTHLLPLRSVVQTWTLCGKVGICLPMVSSLQYRTLTNCMYWFPLTTKLPIVT